jgi:hypothetical protein
MPNANDVAPWHGLDVAARCQERGIFEMTTLGEARFELDRQLVALGVPLVRDVRFFLYPDPSRRCVLACAKRSDGGADIQVVFELPTVRRR